MSEIKERITGLVAGFDARVQAAPADAWSNPAPCEGWAARDVVVHVADNLLRVGGGLQGQQLTPVAADEDIVAAWDRARDAFAAAIADADLAVEVPGPMGPMAAEDLIGRFVANDVLVHTWDLARATGGDEQLPAEIVERAYSGLKPIGDMLRRPGVFGPAVEAPEGADLQTEFLAFLGRRA